MENKKAGRKTVFDKPMTNTEKQQNARRKAFSKMTYAVEEISTSNLITMLPKLLSKKDLKLYGEDLLSQKEGIEPKKFYALKILKELEKRVNELQ